MGERERDNHIATVEPSALMKDCSRCIMGGSNVDEDGSGGNSQSRQDAETETSVPRIRVFGGGVARELFWRNSLGVVSFRSVLYLWAKRQPKEVDDSSRWGPGVVDPGPRLGVFWGLWAPPAAPLWLSGSSGEK